MKKMQSILAAAALAALPAAAFNFVVHVDPPELPPAEVTVEGSWLVGGEVRADVDSTCEAAFYASEDADEAIATASDIPFKTDADGYFVLSLDVPDAVTNDMFWVGLAPDGNGEIEPRMRIAPVPFAIAAGHAALVEEDGRLNLTGTPTAEYASTTGDVLAETLTIPEDGSLSALNLDFDSVRVESLELGDGNGLALFQEDLDTNANYDYVSGATEMKGYCSVKLENSELKEEVVADSKTFTAEHDGFVEIALKAEVGYYIKPPKLTVKVGSTTIADGLEIGTDKTYDNLDSAGSITTYRYMSFPVRANETVEVKLEANIDYTVDVSLYEALLVASTREWTIFDATLRAKVRFAYFGYDN